MAQYWDKKWLPELFIPNLKVTRSYQQKVRKNWLWWKEITEAQWIVWIESLTAFRLYYTPRIPLQ